MIIHLQESGGFAVQHRSHKIDTEQLADDVALKISKAARSCHHSPGQSRVGADCRAYKIKIADDGKSRELVFDDMTMTPELHSLVEQIKSLA